MCEAFFARFSWTRHQDTSTSITHTSITSVRLGSGWTCRERMGIFINLYSEHIQGLAKIRIEELLVSFKMKKINESF